VTCTKQDDNLFLTLKSVQGLTIKVVDLVSSLQHLLDFQTCYLVSEVYIGHILYGVDKLKSLWG
jgi:hypothetical protein